MTHHSNECPHKKRRATLDKITRYIPFVAGILSLIWFLIRVIPKPSRATYPCQQATLTSTTRALAWLIGLFASSLFIKKALKNWRRGSVVFALFSTVAALFFISTLPPDSAQAAWTPTDAPNTPIGVARGIYPGRVTWVRDTKATLWNGSGNWWSDVNTDQNVVDQMLSTSIRWLAGINSDANAWDAIFKYFNSTHAKGNIGYTSGEGIAIKLNQNAAQADTHAGNASFNGSNAIGASPQLVLALVRQLVNEAGVPAGDILIYDASRLVGDYIYDPVHTEFPAVRFMDLTGGDNREAANWGSPIIHYAVSNNCGTQIPTQIEDVGYLINMAIMKNHDIVGPTLNAKNHYGTIGQSENTLDHSWITGKMGMVHYNPLVDLMGHKHLGEKTVLFMIDGLYGSTDTRSSPSKWQMSPFNNDWMASLFLSQDNVAIDSVGFDFINAEWGVYQYTDNNLHEAALANNPPSGVTYAPNGDGVRLKSLGVHEHWNNSTDKKYSRDLGSGNGIELLRSAPVFVVPDSGVVADAGMLDATSDTTAPDISISDMKTSDTASQLDSGIAEDHGATADTASKLDLTPSHDSSLIVDKGTNIDASSSEKKLKGSGCHLNSESDFSLLSVLALFMAFLLRRRNET